MGENKKVNAFGGELRFEDVAHCYTWNGTPVPGVTSILKQLNKPALINWAAGAAADHVLSQYQEGMNRNAMELLCREAKGAHNRIRDKAAVTGTKVHSYVEALFKGRSLPSVDDEQARNAISAFESWLKTININVLESEQILFSKQHWYAGTADIIAEIEGQLTLADIKTSSGIYDEMWMQLAAYTQALEEMRSELSIKQWLIIRLDKKTGAFEVGRMTRNSLYIDAFLDCRRLDKARKLMEELKNEHLQILTRPVQLSLVRAKRGPAIRQRAARPKRQQIVITGE